MPGRCKWRFGWREGSSWLFPPNGGARREGLALLGFDAPGDDGAQALDLGDQLICGPAGVFVGVRQSCLHRLMGLILHNEFYIAI